MATKKKIIIVILAVVFALAGMGMKSPPAPKVKCLQWRTIHHGGGQFWHWKHFNPHKGYKVCVKWSGKYEKHSKVAKAWAFVVTDVVKDTSVTIKTNNFPDNVWFEVHMGRIKEDAFQWIRLEDLDSDAGGSFQATFDIPEEFEDSSNLLIRLIQTKKNIPYEQWFPNQTGTWTGYVKGYPATKSSIPSLWIDSVEKDETVTITAENYPSDVTLDVLMGEMDSEEERGQKVGTLTVGEGGKKSATFDIPEDLKGLDQISLITQNEKEGYYSFNWFDNK